MLSIDNHSVERSFFISLTVDLEEKMKFLPLVATAICLSFLFSCTHQAKEIPLTVQIGKTTPSDITNVLGPISFDPNIGGHDNGALRFKDDEGNTTRRINYIVRVEDRYYVNLTVCLQNGRCLSSIFSPAGERYGYTLFSFEFENDILTKVFPVMQ